MRDYDPDWIRKYYDAYGMQEWNRWEASQLERTKWFVHLHHLRRHVTQNDRVLEIGAGAGRYTQVLATIAKSVVVGNISPVQLELNRTNALDHGFSGIVEEWIECDLCTLDQSFPQDAFDAALCYGGR